jgi:hypothetical protein
VLAVGADGASEDGDLEISALAAEVLDLVSRAVAVDEGGGGVVGRDADQLHAAVVALVSRWRTRPPESLELRKEIHRKVLCIEHLFVYAADHVRTAHRRAAGGDHAAAWRRG